MGQYLMTQARLELLSTLEELSVLYPEMRFGQWVANLASHALDGTAEVVWDVEDEELSAAAREFAQNFRDMRPERVSEWQQWGGASALMSPARRELLILLKQLLGCCDWRVGQLTANLATAAELQTVRHGFPEAVWDAEDEELLPAARKLLEYFRSTRSEPIQLLEGVRK